MVTSVMADFAAAFTGGLVAGVVIGLVEWIEDKARRRRAQREQDAQREADARRYVVEGLR
jgi:hypothetical protein